MATATRQVELRSQLPDVPFVCAQINPSAIIEGKPETRCALLSRSRDNSLSTMAWDCTAGRFYWYYNEDESIVVVAGDARISIDGGPEQVVGIGDTIYFPSGSVQRVKVTNSDGIAAVSEYKDGTWPGFFR